MAKKKPSVDAARKEPAGLTDLERATRVLNSQGKSLAYLRTMGADELIALANLTTPTGELLPGLVRKCNEFWGAYHERRKATTDEPTPKF